VTIADLSREISKAHLGLRTDGAGRVWAVDRNSTNGSLLTRADGSEGRLVPGAEVEVAPGDVIRIGNHTITLQLVNEVRVAVR
jgi:pSer/pThr/pTyr-binding forkhead associated (FHA) protein